MTINSKAGGVEFRNVSRHFGALKAVDNISFQVEPGTLVTLLGPSGCGKTTTLRMIAGLEMASSGAILIGGKDVTHLPATDRDVTMVFQSYALFPHMTVLENVCFGLEMSGVSRKEREEKAAQGLQRVGLSGYEKRLPSELSGGQQQRVALARALILEPQVLLFDEPLSNLDAKLRRKMRDDIRQLQQEFGLTSVYVTHDQEEALAVSDKIIVMNRSVIAQEGTPEDLYLRPTDAFVADFIGGANLLDAVVTAKECDRTTVSVGGMTVTVPANGSDRSNVMIAVRPQAVRLRPHAGENTMEVIVRKATYLGSHLEYVLDSAVGEIFAIDANVGCAVKVGSSAFIHLDDNGVALVGR